MEMTEGFLHCEARNNIVGLAVNLCLERETCSLKPKQNVGKVKVCLTRTAFYFVGKVTRDLATKHQRPIIFA